MVRTASQILADVDRYNLANYPHDPESCTWCGNPMPRRTTVCGRPRRYCQQSCRQRAYLNRRRG